MLEARVQPAMKKKKPKELISEENKKEKSKWVWTRDVWYGFEKIHQELCTIMKKQGNTSDWRSCTKSHCDAALWDHGIIKIMVSLG